MNATLLGAVAGTIATAPMTWVMRSIHENLPWRQRKEPIPPRQITMRAAESVGVKEQMDEPTRKAATMVSHYAYGASVGATYGAVERYLPGTPLTRGILFGLGVWAGSYLGWLPAARVLPSAKHWPAGRNTMMIVSHIVWGGVTGVLTHAFRRQTAAGWR